MIILVSMLRLWIATLLKDLPITTYPHFFDTSFSVYLLLQYLILLFIVLTYIKYSGITAAIASKIVTALNIGRK